MIKPFCFALLFSCSLLWICCTSLEAQTYDILIKNGHVIDPKNKIDHVMDIGIKEGQIVRVAKLILTKNSKKVIDAKGHYVVPGLLDIHSHNFHGTEPDAYLSNSFTALPPDGFSFRSGITTIVDVGGAGWKNFDLFNTQTIARSKTRVLSFLNIVGSGMKGGAIEQNLSDMDAAKTAKKVLEYPKTIVGIKLAHFQGADWTPTERAVAAGKLANVPVMIDFGGSEPELSLKTLLMEKLRPGDIFTHTFAHVKGRTPIVDREGKVRDYVNWAQQRGVLFDVGHGGGSFIFKQAIPAIKQGFKPNTISTDLHTGSMNGGMKDLLNVMSKFRNMGLRLQEVIAAVTWDAAQAIQRPDLGHLSEGAVADITLINERTGTFGFVDTQGKKLLGNKKLSCELTLREGNVVYDLNGLSSEPWDKEK